MSKMRLYGLAMCLLVLSLAGAGCGTQGVPVINLVGTNLSGSGTLEVMEQVAEPSAESADPIKRSKEMRRQENLKKFVEEGIGSRLNEDAIASAMVSQELVTLTDDSETMTVQVPKSWNDVEFGTWIYNGKAIGTYIAASTDLDSFNRDLSAPGMFFGASAHLLEDTTVKKLVRAEKKRLKEIDKNCKAKTSVSFESVFMQGDYWPFDKCKNRPTHHYIVGIMQPPTNQYAVLLQINAPTEASYDATMAILDSFHVTGVPEIDDHHHH